jgi:hypothetical protein
MSMLADWEGKREVDFMNIRKNDFAPFLYQIYMCICYIDYICKAF